MLVGQGARLRSHRLGEVGEHRGVDPVGLGELARGLGEIPDLPGVDDRHRHPGQSEGRRGGLLEPPVASSTASATSSFRRRRTTERMPRSSLVASTYSPLGRSITSRRPWLRRCPRRWTFPSSACSPPHLALPCRCGLASKAWRPGQLFGLCWRKGRDDPRYSTVSERSSDHGAVGLRALTADFTATRNIQGAG